jgi:fumarate hydratase class II
MTSPNQPDFRFETDSMGEVRVPAHVHYGAGTQRAVENFPISGMRFPRRFIRALGLIKGAAAQTNKELGLLKPDHADAITKAAKEVAEGKWDLEFVVDIFQTGSGTSTHINTNEVLSSRANELLGGKKGDRKPIRPAEDVNKCQSSNDVIPTAIHLAALEAIEQDLLPALEELAAGLEKKAEEFNDVLKTGRTHLQDAVPIMLGQEFSGYASQVRHAIVRIRAAENHLQEVPIGGTAVGTGMNAHCDFGRRVCALVSEATGIRLREAENKFEATGSRDALVETSGALKAVAVSLIKIASDIRLLSCGPRTGIAEIKLPELQPGSSIMPGKVNPVTPEMMIQVGAQVIGNDAAITFGGAFGQLDLNVMMPLMAHNLLQSIALLSSAARTFNRRCVSGGPELKDNPDNVRGIVADAERCRKLVENSLMPVTALVPAIGYDKAAAVAKEALRTGKTVREIVLEWKLIPADQLDKLLDLTAMTRCGIRAGAGGG